MRASGGGRWRRASTNSSNALALDLQQHAFGVIAHEAVERELARQPMHEWPKAHALHGAAHAHAKARRRGRGRLLVHPIIPPSRD